MLKPSDIHGGCAMGGVAAPPQGAGRIDHVAARRTHGRDRPEGQIWVKATCWDGIAPSISGAAMHGLMIDTFDNTNRAKTRLNDPITAESIRPGSDPTATG